MSPFVDKPEFVLYTTRLGFAPILIYFVKYENTVKIFSQKFVKIFNQNQSAKRGA